VASKADLKAIGFVGLDSAFGVGDGNITFNSNFSFYFGTGTVRTARSIFKPSLHTSWDTCSASFLLYMANYQFCLNARVFDLLIPLPECTISLFYSFI